MTLVHPVSFESNTPTQNDVSRTPRREHPGRAPTGPTFHQLGLPQPLVTALERRGIHRPFAIQTSALPDALAGRDVLGKAATGSGKTLAFGLPLLARIGAEVKQGRRAPRGLVLVPDPRAGPAGARQPGPARPGHRRAARHRLRRRADVPPDPAAAPRRRRHHRHPRPPAGPDQPGRGHPRRGRRHGPRRGRLHGRPRLPARSSRSCSTRPTATPSGCCSRPRWTARSTPWSAAT